MQNFAERLEAELLKSLPGTGVQWQMASSDRMLKDFPKVPGNDVRIAAVLILLYPGNGSIRTVFIQRPDYNGVHSGQISFPGGKKEPTDNDIVQTATRETNEEIGIDPEKITIVGKLTPLFIPVSNMIVTPVVGWMNSKPLFNIQSEEVVYAFEADIPRFLDQSIVKVKPMPVRGEIFEVKYFDYDGKVIWGATAMILNELLTIIRKANISVVL